MRILEQSKDVLTLQNPARDFWFGNIFFLFSSPLIMLLLAGFGGWSIFLCLFLLASTFLLALTNIWASNIVKVCSFDKTLSKVTVKYHGLQVKIKDFPLQNVRKIEVIKSTGFAYGAVLEHYHLRLVTKNSVAITLSGEYVTEALLEAIASRVQEFLNLRNRSM